MDERVEPGFWQRRTFMKAAAGSVVAGGGAGAMATAAAVPPKADDAVAFPPAEAGTEVHEKPHPLPLPRPQRVGYALVGLGRLTMNQLLPAFAKTRWSAPVALVSGDRAKALRVARHLGLSEQSVYDYQSYDRLADNPAVQVIYVVLPNSMHAEFVIRGAKAGKHILCEKPMAPSVAECQPMIDACRRANRKLMIAYRSQYEPMNRAIAKMAREQRFGGLRDFTAFNGQNQGDPNHWRLKKALAGGGPLPDVGIYCINAARFISGEEPTQVFGHTYATPGDPRFAEVEETVQAILQFPSGLVAQCGASYSTHESRFMRLNGATGWAEMSPAFGYTGLALRVGSVVDNHNTVTLPAIDSGDQFTHEIDHMSRCVLDDVQPHTPGEEGLQDVRIMEAVYASARSGAVVSLTPPGPTRGPEPSDASAG